MNDEKNFRHALDATHPTVMERLPINSVLTYDDGHTAILTDQRGGQHHAYQSIEGHYRFTSDERRYLPGGQRIQAPTAQALLDLLHTIQRMEDQGTL